MYALKEKMKAAVITEPGRIVIKDILIPEIGDNEVLIKVKYCGICETDLKILKGEFSKEYLPFTPGHEFTGYVYKIGKGVENIKTGQYVTVDVNLGCGKCYFCKNGQVLMCKTCKQIGIHKNGGFAEYVKAPENKVYVLPKNMDEIEAVLIEPFANVIRTAKKAKYFPGGSIVILGTSAIALMHVQMTKASAATPIIVIGDDETGLQEAKRCGADYVLKNSADVITKVFDITEGLGADFVLEAEGKTDNYQLSFSLARPGGKVIGFGLTGIEEETPLQLFDIVLREIGFVSSVSADDYDMTDAINLINSQRFQLEYFTDCRYSLENITEAFKCAKNVNNGQKVIVSII